MDQLNQILSRVAGETLGDLAFMFSYPEDEAERVPLDDAVAASVSFSGPFSGSLVIVVPNRVLPEMTENMLGLESDEERATLDLKYDALKETINVICGNVLPAISGNQAIFDMGTPQLITESEAIKKTVKKEDGSQPSSSVSLVLENGQCDLFLFTKGQILLSTDRAEPD